MTLFRARRLYKALCPLLTQEQKDIVYGMLLGDASIEGHPKYTHARIRFGQGGTSKAMYRSIYFMSNFILR
jgi:hypothetical protein